MKIEITDRYNFPVEMYEKRPFLNASRWVLFFIAGQLKFKIRKPIHKDKVFASTGAEEKDSANIRVGVTAHCRCGNIFCDEIIAGKYPTNGSLYMKQ